MNIYILRHGPAAKRGGPALHTDRRRPLTDEGEQKVRKIAKAMKAMGLSFDLILSSPFLRAAQTADLVVDVLKARKQLQLADELAAGARPRKLLEALARRQPQPENVLLVGHEPYLSTLLSLLLCGSPAAHVELKKGGLAMLSVPSLQLGQHATLEWLLTPRQLLLMS